MIHTYRLERDDAGKINPGVYEVGIYVPYLEGTGADWEVLHTVKGSSRAMKLVNSLNGGEYCDPKLWAND